MAANAYVWKVIIRFLTPICVIKRNNVNCVCYRIFAGAHAAIKRNKYISIQGQGRLDIECDNDNQ